MARCGFGGGQFRNAQAVRAHLGYCAVYAGQRAMLRQSTTGLPVRRPLPKAEPPQSAFGPVDHT